MSPENKQIIETSIRHILTAVGENPDRAGLKETPARVARMYEEIFSSLEKKSFDDGKVFDADKSVDDEIVTVKHVPFYSMDCSQYVRQILREIKNRV
ncbi:MAG: GTP cyclohydrolase I, partial [Lentilactobacillus diolivorans]|uniref:GTP cyclohydrolase I n=1 Tax=Lentilactobacillus diolivorans TaxID=179838 RepID=UPI0039EB97E2